MQRAARTFRLDVGHARDHVARPMSDPILQLLATLDRRVTALEEQARGYAAERAELLAEVRALREQLQALRAPGVAAVPPAHAAPIAETSEQLSEREKREILAALTKHNWNKLRASQELGIPRRTFYRRLKEYGIE